MNTLSFTNLTPDEAQLIWNALLELPGKHVYSLAKKLEQQLLAQNAIRASDIPVGDVVGVE